MISVIVPIYNIAKYLPQCIDSIISQTYNDLKIILVDDGSSDDSGRICDRYAAEDSRILVIHKENAGLVSARKTGLDAATGEYVTYVDGDDWIDSDAFENMYRTIEESSADIVFYGHYENTGDAQKIIYHNVEPGVYNKEALIWNIYPRMICSDHFYEWQVFPSVWDMVIRKDLLVRSQYEVDDDITMGEDAACIYPCLLMAERVCFVNEAYYHYRQTSDSMIKSIPDIETERRQFTALYHNVNIRLEKLSCVYDVRKQWLSYMMFLMLPRADHLYKDYAKLDYLFPYTDVKRGMRIAIYGAGTYGRRLYEYVRHTGFCEVTAWFDRNYVQLRQEGLDVFDPDEIAEHEFDGIIIANMFYHSRIQIIDHIRKMCSAEIYSIDEKMIFSDQYLKGFGLTPVEDEAD